MTTEIRRGQVYYADLSPVKGSEQGGIRPVIIIQNDRGNRFAPTVIIAPVTSVLTKHVLPTHVSISDSELPKNSVALCEQIRTIDKKRLKEKITTLDTMTMTKINNAVRISLGV